MLLFRVDVEIESLSESDSEEEVPVYRNKKTFTRRIVKSDPDYYGNTQNNQNQFLNRVSKRLKRFYRRHRPSVWNFFDDRKSSMWASVSL